MFTSTNSFRDTNKIITQETIFDILTRFSIVVEDEKGTQLIEKLITVRKGLDEFDSNKIGTFDMVGFCVHRNIQPRLIKNELSSIIANIKKNIETIKNETLSLCDENEINFLESLEKNILLTCKKHENMIQTLVDDYKIYKKEYE